MQDTNSVESMEERTLRTHEVQQQTQQQSALMATSSDLSLAHPITHTVEADRRVMQWWHLPLIVTCRGPNAIASTSPLPLSSADGVVAMARLPERDGPVTECQSVAWIDPPPAIVN